MKFRFRTNLPSGSRMDETWVHTPPQVGNTCTRCRDSLRSVGNVAIATAVRLNESWERDGFLKGGKIGVLPTC